MDTAGRDYVQGIPKIGVGTYQIRSKKTIFEILDSALAAGYRLIDTAQCYGNETYIGEALQTLLPKHGLTRQDIIVTTKISPANQGFDKASTSIEKSLSNLRMNYIDIVIIHWPGTSKLDPTDMRNATYRLETWRALEKYYNEGKIRAIGLSNYEIKHIEELLKVAKVHPCLNQVEFHPFFHQVDLVEFCKSKGIHFQAYSSFGGPDLKDDIFSDSTIEKLAKKYNVTVPAFLLAWAISQEISVLPRTTKSSRVLEHFSALKVRISDEDIAILLSNGKNNKACWDPKIVV